jgi:uncharacterized protein (TIGR00725 family)
MKKRIAVFGAATNYDNSSVALAERIGRAIVSSGAILVTGATNGLPHHAGKAALEAGGYVLGVSPASNAKEHVERYSRPIDGCSEIFWTGTGFTIRNAINARNCDGAIIVGGEIGTLQEFCATFAEGKVIGVLTSSGGVTRFLEQVVKTCTNHYSAEVFFDSEPEKLVELVMNIFSTGPTY